MIFSELYSAYYNAVAAVLRTACERPVRKADLRRIVNENAFGESVLNIEPALLEERWQLLRADGTTPVRHPPTMPLTTLQKRWLKAVSMDPRVRLFPDPIPDFPEVEPLFRPEDICVYDRYTDGDPFEDEEYIANFRLILDAVRRRVPLSVETVNRHGAAVHRVVMPEYLEYSEKDDKFRLIGSGCSYGGTVNLGRILSVRQVKKLPRPKKPGPEKQRERRTVVLELINLRNALERVLMHFAHFDKEADRLGPGRYRVTVTYEAEDETELVIRVLSFGPMVRVVSPDTFTALIRSRLSRQRALGLRGPAQEPETEEE